MAQQDVLVLGGTGTTGRRLVAALQEAGHPVRAASRRGPVRFDWAAPDTWGPALAGARGLYLMAPDGVAVDPALVSLAVASGVRTIVLLSSAAVEEMGDVRLLDAERAVQESGVDWTVLRPSWFDQVFDEGPFRPAVLAGRLVLPVGDVRSAFVDAGDIGSAAAAALTAPGHAGRTYELRGPHALSFTEAVAVVSRASGRQVSFCGEADDYVQEQLDAGRPREEALAEVAAFSALRARGDDEPAGPRCPVSGRPLTTFERYARGAAARGAWV